MAFLKKNFWVPNQVWNDELEFGMTNLDLESRSVLLIITFKTIAYEPNVV